MPFIVVSNTFVREVNILQEDNEFCVVSPHGDGRHFCVSGFRIRRSRVYRTQAEAEAHAANLPAVRDRAKASAGQNTPGASNARRKTHHDYEMEQYERMVKRSQRMWDYA